MSQTIILTAKTVNVLRVLQKLTSFLSRRNLLIQEMSIKEGEGAGESTIRLTLQTGQEQIHWLVNQMQKCVDLIDLRLERP